MPWEIPKNCPPSCSHSIFIHIFQFDFGCTSYKLLAWTKHVCMEEASEVCDEVRLPGPNMCNALWRKEVRCVVRYACLDQTCVRGGNKRGAWWGATTWTKHVRPDEASEVCSEVCQGDNLYSWTVPGQSRYVPTVVLNSCTFNPYSHFSSWAIYPLYSLCK